MPPCSKRRRPGGWSVARVWFAGVLALVWLTSAAHAEPADDLVRLQLKWYHQFQFAGYYAAQTRGFYAEEGLRVEIIEGGVARPPIAQVTEGGAEFGVSDTDVLLQRMHGRPLVVCAAVFQHSPYVLLSRADRGIRSPGDLVGKRVMVSDSQGETQLRAMLKVAGVDPGRVNLVPHSWNLEELIEGRVDVISAYETVEPARLRARGVEPVVMRTVDYGVDFYGDTLFTTEAQLARHPDRTAAFVRASLKGWAYAMAHSEEMIDHILELPGVRERGATRELLRAEAAEMQRLVTADIVEIGHINEARWRRIAETFVAQGLATGPVDLDAFIYRERVPVERLILKWGLLAAGVAALVAAAVFAWIFQMRRSVLRRTRELKAEVGRRETAEGELLRSAERLRSQLQELERWKAATLGREERIQALKAEVDQLLAESSREPRYRSSAEPPTPPVSR